jgi:hypothetical protein
MANNRYFFILIAVLITSLLFSSCKKDEDDDTSNTPAIPVISDPLHVYGDYFYVNFIGVTGAETYVADVATDQDFSNILPDYDNKDVGVDGMFIVEGLEFVQTYYVRMRAVNANGSSGNSSVVEFNTRIANLLPNMDMEEWIEYQNYESPAPEGVWTSANKVRDLNPGLYPQLLFRTDDAHSGNFAAKAVTREAIGLPLLTGSLSTGVFNVNLDNYLESMIIGVPYKSRPDRFQGYYKYFPVDGDSCEIRTSLTRWNPAIGDREKVGEAIYRTTDTIAEYTFFDLEFEYFLPGNPDTIDMVFAASAGGEYFLGGDGSTIYIDDFTLIFFELK